MPPTPSARRGYTLVAVGAFCFVLNAGVSRVIQAAGVDSMTLTTVRCTGTAMVLLAVGGVLYTAGGVAYAIKWPNPWPGVFGYHEVFHAMTIVAASCHYIAVYFALYNSPFV